MLIVWCRFSTCYDVALVIKMTVDERWSVFEIECKYFFVLLHCIKYFYALSLCILTHVLDGGRDPREWEILGSCSANWKASEVSAALYAAKWIIQSSITASRQPTAMFSTGRCHVTLFPWKIHPCDATFCHISLTICIYSNNWKSRNRQCKSSLEDAEWVNCHPIESLSCIQDICLNCVVTSSR